MRKQAATIEWRIAEDGTKGSLHLDAPFFPQTIQHFALRGNPA